MRSYIKVLVFDLDGTLADTIPAITEAVNMTLEALSLPARTESEVQSFIGKGPRHLINESLPPEVRDEETLTRALALYDKMYAKTYMHTKALYPGIAEAIDELSKYYKIAVLSNKQDEYVKGIISNLLPTGLCSLICGSVDGIPAKPAPYTALKIASTLGVTPCECIMIGDSDIDILTAENAGFDILSVSWGYVSKTKLIMKGAQEIVSTPEEMLEYFK